MLLLLVVILGLSIFSWAACKQATEVDAPGCNDNEAPVITGLNFEINGIPASSSEDLIISNDDELWVYYLYKDDDCNLDGGKIYLQLDGGAWEVAKILPDGTPCSFTDPNGKVGIKITVDDYNLDLGTHEVFTGWVDNCSIRSESLGFYFKVSDAPTDDDDSNQGQWGLIENGGFEDEDAYWQQSGANIIKEKKNLDRLPFQGDWAAEFIGSDILEPRLKQAFDIPEGIGRLDIIFYYNVTSDDNTGSANDKLHIGLTDVSGNKVYKGFVVISNTAATNNYQKYSSFYVVPENLEGEEVYINFQTEFNDDDKNTVFIIDNVTITGE